MGPFAHTLDLPQSEEKGFMGYLLPFLYGLRSKLVHIQDKSTYCEPLAEALIAGIDKRFGTIRDEGPQIACSKFDPSTF